MIVTVTANPSLDRTVEVPVLRRGEVVRATVTRVDPGGKGVNVARALHANSRTSTAVVPVGGATGAALVALLAAQDVPVRTVPVAGETRTNLTLVEPDGTTTKVNEPGSRLLPGDTAALRSAVLAAAAGASWVAVSGSLPPGMAPSWVAGLVAAVGVRMAVDSSGPAFAAAVQAGPALLAPNRDELAEWAGLPLPDLAAVVGAAGMLLDRGVGAALVSLGADGAVLVDRFGPPLHARATATVVRSTVGAGDAALAGYLAHADEGRERALAAAVAWGTAAVAMPGTRMPGPAEVAAARVTVTAVGPGRPPGG